VLIFWLSYAAAVIDKAAVITNISSSKFGHHRLLINVFRLLATLEGSWIIIEVIEIMRDGPQPMIANMRSLQ
jgi:hypothetical protein